MDILVPRGLDLAIELKTEEACGRQRKLTTDRRMSQQTDRGGLRPAEAYDSQKKFRTETQFVKITGSLGVSQKVRRGFSKMETLDVQAEKAPMGPPTRLIESIAVTHPAPNPNAWWRVANEGTLF